MSNTTEMDWFDITSTEIMSMPMAKHPSLGPLGLVPYTSKP